jgi:NADH-quinone oxidoreductase subunit N
MGANLNVIAPSLILYAGAGLVLLAAIASTRALRPIVITALVLAGVYAVAQGAAGAAESAFEGAVRVDAFSVFFAVLITVATLAVVLAGAEWVEARSQRGEFYSLLLVSAASMLLLTQTTDLIALFVALETTSIAQFILAGIARDDRSSEAGLKYLLYGAISAAVLLYGFAFLFGLAGATSLDAIAAYVATANQGARIALLFGFILVAAGLGFKMALFPFHAWAPDVYQGAPTVVTSFLSVASKAAGFAVVLRVFYVGLGGGGTYIANDWAIMFGVLAALSMTFGNIAAIMQTDVKRLLGYSSIAQAGNIAIGLAAVAAGSTVGASGVLFFLGTYLATNLGAFICVIAIGQRIGSDDIRDYAGLAKRSPWLAGILTLCLLSLTGIPPTAGFLAKLYVFNSAIQAQGASEFVSNLGSKLPPSAPAFVGDLVDGVVERWLVIIVAVGVLNTAISAFYYLRWARTMILDEPRDASGFRVPGAVQGVLAVAVVGVLLFGLVPAPLITAARHAAEALQ